MAADNSFSAVEVEFDPWKTPDDAPGTWSEPFEASIQTVHWLENSDMFFASSGSNLVIGCSGAASSPRSHCNFCPCNPY